MTLTDQTLRRVLRREIAGTIGLLADEHDFHAMRRYRSFAFDDHTAYLHQVEALLRARDGQGSHTAVALFDPEEYADFCARAGLDPEAGASRSRYTAELAVTGPTVPYDGGPLADLVPALIDEAVRQATREYTSGLLARLGACATCGEDLGLAAFRRASDLVQRVLDTAPPGNRHLVCSVWGPGESLVSVLNADHGPDGPEPPDEAEALEFTSVLALGLATHSPGGLVLRAWTPGRRDQVYGWRLRGYGFEPLTAAEVFDAYCTDGDSGDLIPPEPDVDYGTPPGLGDDGPGPGHHH
ncbi:hypothetical protein [Streptomyces tagetis]|uniref:Uncharacterized protein n=1 Tax=Streptomyces tagetis TaxID=2820809 RepID=A0A941B2N4_9ACTN|nr:hypothetical protein [Streptomyces sp. RG38]MBQ0829600.1 hypothetical protein [Streptomyces sp. RG38]